MTAQPPPSDVEQFHPRARAALSDPQVRQNFRRAMDGLMAKRKAAFADWDLDALRDLGAAVRQRALAELPNLLEQLEQQLQANGIQVHWAVDGDHACRIVTDICRARDARRVIKGKSMVSEEMELNHYLEQHGIEALESDLGEYIVQLAEETPSHIIMPAIHKNTDEISELLHDKTGTRRSHDVEYLTASARQQLREKFMQADVGISGVNFAVASTGTLCLVENEGNGRMTTTVPPCHIAVTGIEKVVPGLDEVAVLLALLTRSATGQHITTYFNMISGPRQPDELDGPEEVHVVLVDNGRATLYQDPELRDTLRCIRCGACMNHCPVYTRVGGHTYGTTYPGPIGKILMPHLLGLASTRHLPSASSLCGACGEVCPVRIPIPDLLVRLRREAVDGDRLHPSRVAGHGSKRNPVEAVAWRSWRWLHSNGGRYRLGTALATRFRRLQPANLGAWTQYRTAPRLASRSLHQWVRQRSKQESDES
ncbi:MULTISPECIES: LutB/LldF family L-lactate oxidation iron-sulfur protein [Marinobacter]|uniref:LutB/LldF family L-lactate oxidation iron-sulfur protein n=1 Tax=Marinobacter TaxID=2742 RepID=UPI001D06A353|nr:MULTISPECIES: LutB/LldF family L-lactate oxidation iron-sulfur protein [Marinobacter]MCK7565313.1 LutB/LldF family L-lactate oxidation iron-sulfur protein [Marinobacter xestospongiae]UDL06088.1 iron-sulfur cluster-binding protein [Marinobacter sp. CA1]